MAIAVDHRADAPAGGVASAATGDRKQQARQRLLNPGPHPWSSRSIVYVVVGAILVVALWGVSMVTHSEEPTVITPAAISASEGVQVTVQATTFNQATSTISVRLKPKAIGDLVDDRGMLRMPIALRVLDDEEVRLIEYAVGDPLSAQEINFQLDGDVNRYPFDTYQGDFSVLAEKVAKDGSLTPLPLSLGTAKAKTGWFTKYSLTPGAGAEEKVTIVSMKREAFIVSFAVMLAVLMLIVAAMAVVVGLLCITNRRESDPGMVGWLVGLLFALPFVRRMLPGDPPIGCLLDVAVFAWAILLCVVAMVLALVAWLRQSRAKLDQG